MNNEQMKECQEFFTACTQNDIIVNINRSGNLVYKMDGETIKLPMVIKFTKMPQPKGFAEWLNEEEKQDDTAIWVDEASAWNMVKPVFSVYKGGKLKMDARPDWDAALAERFDKGDIDLTFTDCELSVQTMYEVMEKTKKCKFVVGKELFVKKLQGRFNAKKFDDRKDLAELIKYVPQEVDHLKYWMTEMKFQELDLSYDMMRHWLWLVKRNLAGLATRFEVFMVWRSLTHGTGKSWSINYLMKVLENFSFGYEVKGLTEERACALDSHNYLVLNFDELSKAEMADIDSLKKWVTAQELSYRPMGTNNSTSVKKYASGIGTVNRPLSSIIKDITGNRRFVELIIETETRPNFGEEFSENGSAWLSIWKNIDENLENGYYDPEAKEEQKLFVQRCLSAGDVVCNMLEDVFVWEEPTRTKASRQTIYELYRSYCRANGYNPLNADNFRTSITVQLSSTKFAVKYQNRSGQHNYWMPSINSDWGYLLSPIGKTNLEESFVVAKDMSSSVSNLLPVIEDNEESSNIDFS